MSNDKGEELREGMRRLETDSPLLYRYVTRLEATVAKQSAQADLQRKAAVGGLRLMYWLVFGSDLVRSTATFTAELDAWVSGAPAEDGGQRRFPYDASGRVGAAAFMRLVRVSCLGLAIAVLPASILIVQTALMSQQNQYIQKQLDIQASETRLTRRAQLLSVLYDASSDCKRTREESCPPRASKRARGEAARVLANMGRGSLGGLKPEGANLTRVDLSHVSLVGVDFSMADLRGAVLSSADLSGGRLDDAQLQGTNLVEAKLEGASMLRARLSSARLAEAILVKADLSDAALTKANLSESDLSSASLERAVMTETVLVGADLFRAKLGGAVLTDTNLQKSRLSEADLSGVRFVRVNLAGAELSKVKLEGATYDALTVWPKGFDPQAHGAKLR